MNRGVRRLLIKVAKFVIVPVILVLLGYLVLGPIVSGMLTGDSQAPSKADTRT